MTGDTLQKRYISHETLFDLLREGEQVEMRIKGNSMLPFIVGDRDTVVLIKATADSIRKGRIVVAQIASDTYYLHRIVRIEGDTVTLRGDGNPYLRETCPVSSILAEMVELNRNGRIYTPRSWAWKAAWRCWPSNGFLRRILLRIYRSIA